MGERWSQSPPHEDVSGGLDLVRRDASLLRLAGPPGGRRPREGRGEVVTRPWQGRSH